MQNMIFFDIDDTLMNNTAAMRDATVLFYNLHENIIQESLDKFQDRWRTLAEHYVHRYLTGELSFQDQRRERLRQLFANKRILSDVEADTMYNSYLTFYENSWKLFPEVKDCLNELTGVNLGIISNGDAILQKQKLRSLGIIDNFTTIVISGEVGISKPDSRIFLMACRKAGVSPSECWHVGDDLKVDVQGSISSGINGIWLNRNGQEHYTGITFIIDTKRFLPLCEI
jgi:putative hydrolase of the HAD superfamily